MNRKIFTGFGALMLALLAAGCGTPSTPHGTYPVTYNIQVDNTQNSSTNATQDIAVASGQVLYYRVVSPVDATVYFYGVEGEGQRMFLSQMQGRVFTSSITPSTGTLEFVFIATPPNSSGTLKFTLSDQPIAPAVAHEVTP